jgi:glycine/D-amino acid oxidase-like deaminating enzyme
MSSAWRDNLNKVSFDSLQRDINTDVLIIGGGIAGILCAYMLKRRGVGCIVLEKGDICSAVTADTTAKITAQHNLIYSELAKKSGYERAGMYYQAQTEALEEYKKIAAGIDCDFEIRDSFVYSKNNRRKLEEEALIIDKIGGHAELTSANELPFKTVGAVKFENQAQFNPLKFLFALSRELNIFEHSEVFEVRRNVAYCGKYRVKADKIIVATHFPFMNRRGMYFMKMYQQRSYVLGLEGSSCVEGMYIDEDESGLSFRSYKNLLLLGGGGHRTGKNGGGWDELKRVAEKYYPGSSIKYKWATQDCITLDKMPYIGHYSKNTPELYVATGFNKWGMTNSMLSAMILSDTVCGKPNEYSELFSPGRSMMNFQLAKNIASSAAGLVSFRRPRCPHLGCALKYNYQEHSWDCPCHGSRFDESGKLLNNPATSDKKFK